MIPLWQTFVAGRLGCCWLSVVVFLLLSVVLEAGRLSPLLARFWSTADGLSQNSIRFVHRAQDGFLWLGTDMGLWRFDGKQFRAGRIQREDADFTGRCNAIVEGDDGVLWVGTTEGLLRCEGLDFQLLGAEDGLTHEFIFSLALDGRDIWIGTNKGLAVYREGRFEIELSPARIIHDIIVRENQSVWICRDNGVDVFDPEDRTLLEVISLASLVEEGKYAVVRSGFEHADGSVWIASDIGVFRYVENMLEVVPIDSPSTPTRVSALTQVHGDQVWMLMDGRPYEYVDGAFRLWAAGASVENFNLTYLMADFEGNIWCGAGLDGLCQLRTPPVRMITSEDGLVSELIGAIVNTRSYGLLVCSDAGVMRYRDGGFEPFKEIPELASGSIYLLAEGPQKSVWASGQYSGLSNYWVTQSGFEMLGKRLPGPSGARRVLTPDTRDHVWQGSLHGFMSARRLYTNDIGLPAKPRSFDHRAYHRDSVYRFRERGNEVLSGGIMNLDDSYVHPTLGQLTVNHREGPIEKFESILDPDWRWMSQLGGLSSYNVLDIAESRDGHIWVATLGGGCYEINRDQGGVSVWTTDHGLSSNNVNVLEEDSDGRMWVGSRSGLSIEVNQGEWRSVELAHLRDVSVRSIVFDRIGFAWLGTNRGILGADRGEVVKAITSGQRYHSWIHLDRSDGIETGEVGTTFQPSACELPSGQLWFAAPRGIAEVSLNERKLNRYVPRVIFESLVPFVGEAVTFPYRDAKDPSRLQVRLEPGMGDRIEIHFASLSLQCPEKNLFEYRLDPVDEKWFFSGTRSSATYTKLPPGDYLFRVRGSNNHGIWSPREETLRISIAPHWYQTLWFRGSLLLLALAGISGVWFWQVRSVQRRAIESERKRIAADLHDDIGANLVGLSQMADNVVNHPSVPAVVRERAMLMRNLSRETDESLRDLGFVMDTKPCSLEDLKTQLLRRTLRILQLNEIELEMDFDRRLGEYLLPRSVGVDVMRACQEALTNVVRHSQAKKAEVAFRLLEGAGAFEVVVRDDGVGFPVDAVELRSNGLNGIEDRCRRSGGEAVFWSQSGRGSRVTMVIPLRHNGK